MKAQDRRKIYASSLKVHIDALSHPTPGMHAEPHFLRTSREDTRVRSKTALVS